MRANARDEVNYSDMGSTASQMVPKVYAAAKDCLTTHGLELLITQLQASLKYVVLEQDTLDVSCSSDPITLDTCAPDETTDANLLDMPRFRCLAEVVAAKEHMPNDYMALLVTPRHTHEGHLKNPHWILLSNKTNGAYIDFYCTCGSSVRCGMPCRHFWAVMLSPGCYPIGFHFGHINDLWFKVAQRPTSELTLYSYGSYTGQEEQLIQFSRPLFAAATSRLATSRSAARAAALEDDPALAADDETPPDDPRLLLSQKRAYGELLGMAKKAVEAALAGGGGGYAALRAMLQHFVPGGESSTRTVQNPAVIQGKGRPKNSKNKPKSAAAGRPSQLACGNSIFRAKAT